MNRQTTIHDLKLDKKDLILIKNEQEVNKLMEWKDANKRLVRNFNVVLNQAVIKYPNGMYHWFKWEDTASTPYMHHLLVSPNKDHIIIEFIAIPHYIGDDRFWKVQDLQYNGNPEVEEHFKQDMLTIHSTVMAYMEHYREVRERVSSKRVSQPVVKKKKRKTKRVAKLGRIVYQINVPSVESIKREYKRRSESWTVRGHWRNYKNGKKVWIRPHVRGEKKESVEGKVYSF